MKRGKEVKIQVLNLDVQEKLGEMKETAEKSNDELKIKDMPFIKKALIDLGGQHGDEIVSREVWERHAVMIWESLSLEMESR